MVLDPGAATIVEVLTQAFPDVGGEVDDPVEARRILQEAPLPEVDPPPVARVENRTIPGPAGAPDLPVRIYWPAPPGGTAGEPLPVVVFFHGGGWVLCDLDTHDTQCRTIANGLDAIVISVDYRLAPEHPYPAAAEDAYAAVCWARDRAGDLGGDGERVMVAGDSAGGNLAAATALRCRDEGGPELRAQLLIYPVLNHDFSTPSYRENAEGYFLTATNMRWFWAQYLGDDGDGSHPYASPLRADDLTGLPPAHIVVGEHDPLRDEGIAYGRRLQEAGVPVEVRCYDGMFHGFFGMGAVLDTAQRANEEAFTTLRSVLDRA